MKSKYNRKRTMRKYEYPEIELKDDSPYSFQNNFKSQMVKNEVSKSLNVSAFKH